MNWPVWAARAILVVLILFTFLLGGFVAGVGFHDPDTCWLLALGRWIAEHGYLPAADPFSYTHALTGRPFIAYQWLAEVLFYSVEKALGLVGLLSLAAGVLCFAFVILPLAMFHLRRVPMLVALLLLPLPAVAAGFHFLVRPEIFSYLILSSWLFLILRADSEPELTRSSRLLLLVGLPVSMLAWCNMHTGFVIGLLVLLLFVVQAALCAAMRAGRPRSQGESQEWGKLRTFAATFLLCLAATLANPWGTGLWSYLPDLFFAPFNSLIVELQPVNPADPAHLAFLALAAITLAAAWKAWQRFPNGLFYFSLPVIVTAAGAACSRLIPFAALLMVPTLAYMLGRTGQSSPSRPSSLEAKLQELIQPARAAVAVLLLFSTVSGTVLCARLIPPAVPQASIAVHVPAGAINYLSRGTPAGRLFNDPGFGDMLLWRMENPPALFIDTRFDMYGSDLINDYRTMIDCGDGWEQLLNKYQIAWLFLPPETKLATALATRGWHKLYADDQAVVLQKTSLSGHNQP